jgi:hypothetical protein
MNTRAQAQLGVGTWRCWCGRGSKAPRGRGEDPWDLDMECCALAARGGYLEMLTWLRGHHCPWDAWTCAYAARGGHLEVLRWAREHRGQVSGTRGRAHSQPQTGTWMC